MKRALLASTLMVASVAVAQDVPRPSPKATVSQTVGVSNVTVTYSRPAMRGRVIWGELVPFDKVWRTGANESTTIAFSDDVEVEGQKLAAGTYSLHTIPSRGEWTVIFNSGALQGNYSHDAAKDVVRVKVTPRAAATSAERMTFSFPTVTDDSAELVLHWEKVEVPVRLKFGTTAKVVEAFKRQFDDWRPAYRAADWAFQNDVAEGMVWVERSIAIKETPQNLALKARMLAKHGDRKNAIAVAERAIAAGKAATPPANMSALEKELAEWRAKK